jgi:octaprenyl-diphosphate synthase
VRRGQPAAWRRFGSHASVLLGDALFAHAVVLATQFPTTEVCRLVAESTRRVCAGEIMQTLRPEDQRPDFARYRRIIELKTAELFFVSCYLGSLLSGRSREAAEAAGRFGRRLGSAYQMYDDLADVFGSEERIGKTLGTDLASGKCTLPLLAMLEDSSAAEQARILAELKQGDHRRVADRLNRLAGSGLFGRVSGVVFAEIDAALAELQPFADGSGERLLAGLAEALRSQVDSLQSG